MGEGTEWVMEGARAGYSWDDGIPPMKKEARQELHNFYCSYGFSCRYWTSFKVTVRKYYQEIKHQKALGDGGTCL